MTRIVATIATLLLALLAVDAHAQNGPDGSPFTPGTSLFMATGGFYQTTATANALTNGQRGLFQMTAQRAIFSNLRDASGNELGLAAAPLAASQYLGTAAVVDDPCRTVTPTSTPISITTATTTRIIAPTSAKKTYICSISLQTNAANNIGIVEGTGGTCGTGTAGVYGGTTSGSGLNFTANEGISMGNGGATIMATAGTNIDFCLITSAATNLAGHVRWVQK